MTTYLVRERLREGTKLSDYEMLKSALATFMDTGLEEQDHDLTKAKHKLVVLQAKQGNVRRRVCARARAPFLTVKLSVVIY